MIKQGRLTGALGRISPRRSRRTDTFSSPPKPVPSWSSHRRRLRAARHQRAGRRRLCNPAFADGRIYVRIFRRAFALCKALPRLPKLPRLKMLKAFSTRVVRTFPVAIAGPNFGNFGNLGNLGNEQASVRALPELPSEIPNSRLYTARSSLKHSAVSLSDGPT